MGIAANVIQKARETVDNLTPTAESIRSTAENTLRGAYDTLRGSGYFTTELGKAKDAALGMVSSAVATPLNAMGKLLTLRPIDAVRETLSGLTETCKNVGKYVVSPAPILLAAAQSSLRTAKDTAVAAYEKPKEAVLRGVDVVSNGLGQVLGFNTSGSESKTVTPPSSDVGGTPITPAPSASATPQSV